MKLGLFSVLGEIWFSGWLFSCLLSGFLACCCCCLLVSVSLSVFFFFFFVCFALLHLHFERGTLNHPSISGRVSCRYVSLPNANFVLYFSLSLAHTLSASSFFRGFGLACNLTLARGAGKPVFPVVCKSFSVSGNASMPQPPISARSPKRSEMRDPKSAQHVISQSAIINVKYMSNDLESELRF